MAAKGYCVSADVETFLGLSFTPAQEAHCDTLIERAEIEIDEDTHRAWLTGEQEGEAHYRPTNHLFLKYAPIEEVTAVTGRRGMGEDEETLDAGTDYEVRDFGAGYIYVVSPWQYDRLLVDYTPVDSVPADLVEAIVEIVAARMQPVLQPGTFGLDSIQLPDYTVRFARSHVQEAVPPAAQKVIDRYRHPVHG